MTDGPQQTPENDLSEGANYNAPMRLGDAELGATEQKVKPTLPNIKNLKEYLDALKKGGRGQENTKEAQQSGNLPEDPSESR